MPLVSRLWASAGAAIALGICSAAAGAAVLTRVASDVENTITFPAAPATRTQLPRSRVRPNADVTWGQADPRAVAAFRAARMFGALRSHGIPPMEVHAGQGYGLTGTAADTLGAYANHTIYPNMREPGDPLKGEVGWLYAPTFFGPGADCIEVTTVIQNQIPQVWAWDWCAATPNPYAVVEVNQKFVMNYVRRMPDKLPKYTVETVLGSDGVTWSMVLYNYRKKAWDVVYQTSGARNPKYGLGEMGWSFFETYMNVNSSETNANAKYNVSNICNQFPGPIAAEDISLSSDGQTFVPIDSSDSYPSPVNNFYCSHFLFSYPQADEWMMSYT
jgi:hypothetical protein